MRAFLQFVVSSVLCGFLLFAVVPVQASARPTEDVKCCAKMKTKAETENCANHAPKSDQEKQCCAACVFCVADFVAPAIPFIYPSTGSEAFRDFVCRELVRSDKPQVPPPRFSVA